jgi:hypothetical protein
MEVNIRFKGIDLTVEGVYTPAEPMVMYYKDMSGYDGANSEFECNTIYAGDVDIFELFSLEDLEKIEELCLISIEE